MIKLLGPFYELIEISRDTNGENLEAKHNSLFLASMSSCHAARWTQHMQMEGVPLSWWKFYSWRNTSLHAQTALINIFSLIVNETSPWSYLLKGSRMIEDSFLQLGSNELRRIDVYSCFMVLL